MCARHRPSILRRMALFLLHSQHHETECRAMYAAWRGFESPLGHSAPWATCLWGGHEVWWETEAEDETAALRHLPPFVAERSRAIRVTRARLP
jgi:hypothetical protein